MFRNEERQAWQVPPGPVKVRGAVELTVPHAVDLTRVSSAALLNTDPRQRNAPICKMASPQALYFPSLSHNSLVPEVASPWACWTPASYVRQEFLERERLPLRWVVKHWQASLRVPSLWSRIRWEQMLLTHWPWAQEASRIGFLLSETITSGHFKMYRGAAITGRHFFSLIGVCCLVILQVRNAPKRLSLKMVMLMERSCLKLVQRGCAPGMLTKAHTRSAASSWDLLVIPQTATTSRDLIFRILMSSV